ncbi:LysM peptidoglycan-binding domain-containing protein [Candidatus Saccharibacteria bacterium]|nr:LysM peptidoglycan-binding domain-containing protein [Candidatus Saccharibacteria bacterium]
MIDKKPTKWERFKQILPYILTAGFTIGLVAVGSINKGTSGASLSLDSFAKSDYDISVDQLTEMYVVADLSDALNLASASDVASNYVVTTSMYDAGQTATGKLEKPSITNIDVSRGVIEHVVQGGESAEVLAAKYGLTADQVRWSNGLKTNEIPVGTVLHLPSVPGIVYTVKSGDTVESIAARYGSSAVEITALNDLEESGVREGAMIVIKNGSLPETERPEYVAPRRASTTYSTTTYRYSYLGSASDRQNIQVIYPRFTGAGGGQCVNWASYMRPDLGALRLGNARDWARGAAAHGYSVNRTPTAGSIFQTSSGWYGHVGYVEAVNADGSITVTEMNYGYVPYRVIRAIIPAGSVGNFNYIH